MAASTLPAQQLGAMAPAAEPPGCPVLLVVPFKGETEDGEAVDGTITMPIRVRPCRDLDEAELASMVGVRQKLLVDGDW